MDEVEFEIRGNDDKWKVFYPDESNIQTPLPWYDKEGNLKTVTWVGDNNDKLTETFEEFSTAKEAIKYAQDYLGAQKIKLIKTKKKKTKKKEKKYDPNL